MTLPHPPNYTAPIKIIVGGFCAVLLLLTVLAQNNWASRARVNLLLEGYFLSEITEVEDLQKEPVESPLGLGTTAYVSYRGSYVGVLDREGSFVSLKPGHKHGNKGLASWRKSTIVLGCIQFLAGVIFVALLCDIIRCRVHRMSQSSDLKSVSERNEA